MPLAPIRNQMGKTLYPKLQSQVLSFSDFPLGVNKLKSKKQLEKGELAECVNFKYNDFGRLETRQGLVRYTTATTTSASPIKQVIRILIQDTTHYFGDSSATFGSGYVFGSSGAKVYMMLVDDSNTVYYIDATNAPTSLGTMIGNTNIVAFAGYAVIMDTSYIKYWRGGNIELAYDDGTGADGYMFDYTDMDQDAYRSLNDTVSKVGGAVTLPDWDSGYTIPTTEIRCVIEAVGAPTGSITAVIYNSDKSSTLATSDAVDASTVATSPTEVRFLFSNKYNLQPSTTYFFSIEYASGTSTDYINVYKDNTTNIEEYYDTAWETGTGTPLFALKPGRPPKGVFGKVRGMRMFFKDPDNPGWIRYTNANSIFDYSTPNGGGYIGLIDDNANRFQLGGLEVLYDDLYAIGEPQSPYLVRIQGLTPSTFTQKTVNRTVSTHYKSIVSTVNDVWFASASGVFAIGTVQQYGDIRNYPVGDPMLPIIQSYWDSEAFAAYNPADGQFIIKLNGYDKILVGHTKRPSISANRVRYPWTEYEFKNLTPSAFAYINDTLYVGCTDGYLYTLTADVNDNGIQPDYSLSTAVQEVPFGAARVEEYYCSADSEATGKFKVKFYKDGSTTATVTKSETTESKPIWSRVYFSFHSIQLGLDTFTITKPFKFQGILLRTTAKEL